MSDPLPLGGLLTAILAGAVRRGTPMAFAAIGEAIAERSGVINLGVEGMMLVGAMASVGVTVRTGSAVLGVLAAGLMATALAALHAALVVRFNANQIISGFALTVLGTGLSGFFGRSFVGVRISGIGVWEVPGLSRLPILGEVLFSHDPLVYSSVVVAVLAWLFLYRTSAGLSVRAVGEDPRAAHAHGVPVARVRFLAVLSGGFLAGIGGAHLSLAYTGVWAEKMTAGQGWIAVGLVIVAGWSPLRGLLAAWLFGAVCVLHPHLQAAGVEVSSYLVATLPYLLAVGALTVATLAYRRRGFGLPAALAKQFEIDRA